MINSTLYDREILRKSRTRGKEKTDRLCKRRKNFERQRSRQLQKAKGAKLTGRPELPLSTEDFDYSVKSVSSVSTAEYNKYIDHVVSSLDIERSDAEYAVNTIGPFHSLISYAYSMYEHNKDRMTFRGAVNRVSEGVFQEEYDVQVLRQEEVQEPRDGLSLGHLLAPAFPTTFSNLPEEEREELRHKLYGDYNGGDIGNVIVEALEQDL
jgi:hypothetical protein